MARIKIDSNLYDRAKEAATVAGYSSVDEFITHAIETALAKHLTAEDEEKIADRLRGLGYIE